MKVSVTKVHHINVHHIESGTTLEIVGLDNFVLYDSDGSFDQFLSSLNSQQQSKFRSFGIQYFYRFPKFVVAKSGNFSGKRLWGQNLNTRTGQFPNY